MYTTIRCVQALFMIVLSIVDSDENDAAFEEILRSNFGSKEGGS